MLDYPFFPAFVDLSGRRALVVGGGRVATRRVNTLSQFCPNVTVVAPRLHPDIDALAGAGQVSVRLRPYREGDLDGADLVLACPLFAGSKNRKNQECTSCMRTQLFCRAKQASVFRSKKCNEIPYKRGGSP